MPSGSDLGWNLTNRRATYRSRRPTPRHRLGQAVVTPKRSRAARHGCIRASVAHACIERADPFARDWSIENATVGIPATTAIVRASESLPMNTIAQRRTRSARRYWFPPAARRSAPDCSKLDLLTLRGSDGAPTSQEFRSSRRARQIDQRDVTVGGPFFAGP